MKRGDLSHWKNIDGCTNLLLFSQLVNELLFDYSIPSNRVSTLNSHYLCMDAMSAIAGIENDGVPEANLKPIMSELYLSLVTDPVFAKSENSPINYYMKYQSEKYTLNGRVSDLSYDDLKRAAKAIYTCFFMDNQYYSNLKQMIVKIIEENSIERQKELFRLIKSLLTELMNMGYSLRYIYEIMNINFWNIKEDIDSPMHINKFFDAFNFEEMEYEVVIAVKRNKMEKFLSFIDDVDFEENCSARFGHHTEKQFYNVKKDIGFLVIKRKALDPYLAAEKAKELISINTAFYRMHDHNYKYNIDTAKCVVYDDNHFYKGTKSVSAVEHKKQKSASQIGESLNLINQVFDSVLKNREINDLHAIINAAMFHSHSLDSSSSENQLLDLWSIFETVLNISSKHTTDRINQICMYLVPILKRNYIFSLFEQLASDIRNYDENKFEKIVAGVDNKTEIIQKVCEFTLLKEKCKDREDFLKECTDFPLLVERIKYYSDILTNTSDVFEFVEKHGERVKWQIMRIYRNRNLIVHNGKSMPYQNLLIENLHSYVDDFMGYTIHSLSKGHSIESMCQEIFIKECNWCANFQRGKKDLNSDIIKLILSL